MEETVGSTVETVRGPVPADSLGLTLGHEHLRFRDEAVAFQWPGRYDEAHELARALEAVALAQSHGVRTIVDPTPMNAGRDFRFMARVSEETGVHVIGCTGIYAFTDTTLYFQTRDADQIADHFVSDIEGDVQGTGARAAFVKVTADVPGLTEAVEKIHRAAARASVRTGAPVMAHSAPAVDNGPKQAALFMEEGVPAHRIQICHYGDTTDVDKIEELLAMGVYVGLDRFGGPPPPTLDERCATAAELLRRGHAERLIVSHDFCPTLDFLPAEMEAGFREAAAGWSTGLVFERVVPYLREQGVLDERAFRTIFHDNPRRWLTG
ncbi:MAG TPA: hypothetical protein VHB30_13690 [Solirubrobacteraceae bacterium]|jgi:phosphotriesterase-related protein|nr:hypothetical protein [Solirubrobacteraceae bacterium]